MHLTLLCGSSLLKILFTVGVSKIKKNSESCDKQLENAKIGTSVFLISNPVLCPSVCTNLFLFLGIPE